MYVHTYIHTYIHTYVCMSGKVLFSTPVTLTTFTPVTLTTIGKLILFPINANSGIYCPFLKNQFLAKTATAESTRRE